MFELYCERCGLSFEIESKIDRCPKCSGPFKLKKEYAEIDVKSIFRKTIKNLWSFDRLFPPTCLKRRVSLGEPLTPILSKEIRYLGKKVRVLLKNEGMFPTGSFKDRGSSVLISHLKFLHVKKTVTDSSGNAGISMAAYSKNAGISIKVYVPSNTSIEKKRILELYGVHLFLTETRDEASELARKSGEFYANHSWNPIFFEGTKTFLYEALLQRRDFDAIFLPLGSGTLFLGAIEALKEIKENLPGFEDIKIFIIRPEGYDIFDLKRKTSRDETIAEGIAVRPIYRLDEIKNAIEKFGVKTIYIDNNDIVDALKLYIKEGIITEPTGAAALAGLLKYIKSRGDLEFSKALIPITGVGFKSIEKLMRLF